MAKSAKKNPQPQAPSQANAPIAPAQDTPKAPPPTVPPANPAPKIIFNSAKTQVLSRSAYRTGTGWLHSPARLKLLTVATRNLVGVAKERGMDVSEVAYARAARVEGQDEIFVYPTDETDPDKLEVTRSDSGVWINLRTLLAPDLLLPPGIKIRYDLKVTGPESPVRQALVFDRSVEKERKITVKKKAGTKKTKGNAKQSDPAEPSADGAKQSNPTNNTNDTTPKGT